MAYQEEYTGHETTLNDAQPPFKYYYQAAASADVVVKGKPGYLEGIIIGTDVGSAVIEVSDHATDGDGNVCVYLADDTLHTTTGGFVPVRCKFDTGITADQTNQTYVTYVYK